MNNTIQTTEDIEAVVWQAEGHWKNYEEQGINTAYFLCQSDYAHDYGKSPDYR